MKSSRRASPAGNLKWLLPGMGVKRWLLLGAVGVTLLGLGLVYLIIVLNHRGLLPDETFRLLTLQPLSPWARIAVAGMAGLAAMGLAFWGLSRSTLAPFLQTQGIPLADAVYQRRRRRRGPHIVAIGGGTGLSALLRGLKKQTSNITAIITVADDGGSSGRLRRELGLPPPGDFRNCIAALADDESLITQLFQYRFGLPAAGDPQTNGELSGHSFGNLFIAAMTGISGSFEGGLEQSSQVLAIQGRILPSTLADVTLVADVREQSHQGTIESAAADSKVHRVAGESSIPQVGRLIERVYLTPGNAPAYPAAMRAILNADLVVLGPGSLYTSVLPNLLVEGIRQALETTRARVIYVCNVATQPGETEDFDAGDHLRALERHIGHGIVDAVLANDSFPPLDEESRTVYVPVGEPRGMNLFHQDLVDRERPWRHDSDRLASAVLSFHDPARSNLP
jgi:uncharacterized cofD-like protein